MSDKVKIVVLDGYTLNPGDISWSQIEELGEVIIYDRTKPAEVQERLKGAQIALTNKVIIGNDVIAKLPELKYIGVLATGYNVVDTFYTSDKKIVVTNIPSYSSYSVVQMVFALLSQHFNNVAEYNELVHKGEWVNSKDFCFYASPQTEMHKLTMGIIGYGEIGQKTAAMAKALGMKVVVHTRTVPVEKEGMAFLMLEDLLQISDVVSLHCPLTDATKGMINKDTLQLMKKNAVLINTSRGPLINEEDLASALNNNQLAGAGLDVLSVEPAQKNNPLLSAKNCIITPHIAWATKGARKRLMGIASENIKAYLRGRIENQVN